MRIIDSDDYIGSGVDTMFFPGGEPHAKVRDGFRGEDTLLFLKLRTWNDVGIAACVMNLLIEAVPFIPYFPGARQDKRDRPRTLAIMADLLMQSATDMHVFDPHSAETQKEAAANVWMPEDLDIPIKDDVVGIIAPDAGAVERANSFRERFYPRALLHTCTKERDPRTGSLSNYKMPPLGKVSDARYIVVDDICDGGGTFNLLAAEFKKQTDAKLELFVSHGIFSRGVSALDPVYEHITTTDSWCSTYRTQTSTRLTVLPLAQLFPKIEEFVNA